MKTFLVASFLLLCPVIWGQTPKARVCHKGYTLEKDGRCIGEFPAGDGCNSITRDQDNPAFAEETALACMPVGGWPKDIESSGPYIISSPSEPHHAVQLTHLTIPLDIRYCDQVSGKDAGAECVQRKSLMFPLPKNFKGWLLPNKVCPSGMHVTTIDSSPELCERNK